MFLGFAYQVLGHCLEVVESTELGCCVHNIAELVEEPAVDFCEFVYAVHGHAVLHGIGDYEDAAVGRALEGALDVVDYRRAVAGEAVHSLADHAQAFLESLFKCASDGHYFAHRFHGRTDVPVYAMELAKVPTGYFHHHIVQGGLEECRGALGYRVGEFEKTETECKFGSHKSQRIAGGLGCQRRRAAEACIHFDYTVVHAFGVVGVLHVALAHDTYMADDFYGETAQEMIVVVGKRLRRCNYDTFPGVYAQRVEVFHVAHGDAVVVSVADNFVFDFFPSPQRFFHENLRRERQRFLHQFAKLAVVVAEAAAEASEGIGCTHNHRVSESVCHLESGIDVFHRLGADSAHIDLVQLFHKQLAVLGVHDGLHGCAKHIHAVTFEHAAAVQFDTAVKSGLAAEGQKNAVGALPLYHTFYEVGSDRQEVYTVCHSLRGLHCGDVRIQKNTLDSFFPQGFKSLGAGIVELSGFTDFEGSAAQKQYFTVFFL